jgi:hypothetical protein
MTNRQCWLRFCYWVKREFPLQYPVKIISKKIKKNRGATTFDGKMFRVYIDSGLQFDVKIDILIHEWAHALTWFGAQHRKDHSGEWGLAHAAIYEKSEEFPYLE